MGRRLPNFFSSTGIVERVTVSQRQQGFRVRRHGRFFIRSPVRFSCACGGGVLAPEGTGVRAGSCHNAHRKLRLSKPWHTPPNEFLAQRANFASLRRKIGQKLVGGSGLTGIAT